LLRKQKRRGKIENLRGENDAVLREKERWWELRYFLLGPLKEKVRDCKKQKKLERKKDASVRGRSALRRGSSPRQKGAAPWGRIGGKRKCHISRGKRLKR